jgi:chemotaxis protein MotB
VAESRGKKRHHDHEEHEEHVNHEAWVIPYADVLTLLMALFLVLFALGRTDEEKLELAADSFRRELGRGESLFDLGIGTGGAGPLVAGGASVLDGAGPAPIRSDAPPDVPAPPTTLPIEETIGPPKVVIVPSAGPVTVPSTTIAPEDEGDLVSDVEQAEEVLGDPLTEVERRVREQAIGTGLTDKIGFRRETRGLVVTIVTDRVLFQEGRAEVQPAGVRILDVVADALLDLPNTVTIEGHTDSRPISTSQYPSNWELSTARATSVLRYLIEQRDFPPQRLSAAGYADTRPIDTGTDPASLARNRRVEIVVLATA